jgi:hypothetical protein
MMGGRSDVKTSLTVFMLARVFPYSSWVQQPVRAMAILGSRLHTRQAARFDHEQDRAGSLHPEGQGFESP